jgi:hypothetical protein
VSRRGRPTLFETGAIVLDIATRAGKLLPIEEGERAAVITWLFAALNPGERVITNGAEVDYFVDDPIEKECRRARVIEAARQRLASLDSALGARARRRRGGGGHRQLECARELEDGRLLVRTQKQLLLYRIPEVRR